MASIRTRTTAAGITSHSVLFRRHGRQTSLTFEDLKSAEDFKKLVDVLGPDKALATYELGDEAAITIDALAERYFAWKAGEVTARTLADYRRDHDNWISPHFGHLLAEVVDELDVQEWVDHMKTLLDPKTVADRHMLLHSMYRYGSARSRRLVSHNPCEETQLPKRGSKPAKGMPLPIWQDFRVRARAVEPDAADLCEFIASTGWRWSEAAALTVGDVEHYTDEDGTELVVATMGGVVRGGVVVPDEAKTAAAFRRSKLTRIAAAIVLKRCAGKAPAAVSYTHLTLPTKRIV